MISELNLTNLTASNLSINLFVTCGSTLYDYVWTNSSGNIIGYNSSISNLPSDSYFVEITDSNGCTYNESYTISDQNENFKT